MMLSQLLSSHAHSFCAHLPAYPGPALKRILSVLLHPHHKTSVCGVVADFMLHHFFCEQPAICKGLSGCLQKNLQQMERLSISLGLENVCMFSVVIILKHST